MYVLQEQIDAEFYADRSIEFDELVSSLWKMGDRKNDNFDSAKSVLANSSAGLEFFKSVKQQVLNGTQSQVSGVLDKYLVVKIIYFMFPSIFLILYFGKGGTAGCDCSDCKSRWCRDGIGQFDKIVRCNEKKKNYRGTISFCFGEM